MNHLEPNQKLYGLPFTTNEFNGMPYRALGNSGLKVSNIGLGTWKFGYPETGDGSRTDLNTSLSILDKSLELGVTFWDTANRYNNSSGNSERIIGKWLKANPDQRRNIVLATKIFGVMDGKTPNHCGLSRSNILDSVYACLERLQTDHIDLLYFHNHDDTTPTEESLTTIEDLVTKGIVRYLGVSNFTVLNLATYIQCEEKLSSRCRVVAVENQFDILNGESNRHLGVLKYVNEKKISFVAWSPLARGLLTNRYLEPKNNKSGDRLFDEGTLQNDLTPSKIQKLKLLNELAKQNRIELSQLVLAYMLNLPGMGPIIPAVSSIEQLTKNADAGKIMLNSETIANIKKILSNS